MQKKSEDQPQEKVDWKKVQKNLKNLESAEQLAWMDTEGEDAGVERQKTTPDSKKEKH